MKKFFGISVLLLVLIVGIAATWLLTSAGNRDHAGVPESADASGLKDPARIAEGRYLVTISDCAGCHTARDGVALAGGKSLATPFGNISAPNLTPDRDTGLGHWNFAQFWQALHDGRGHAGELLYPVFPYTSYTRISARDASAMLAYLQSLPAVHRAAARPALRFPYGIRDSLLVWRALYFRPGVFRPDPARSPQWNRGAYLVQGPGHCIECHAGRDSLGGIPLGMPLAGGQIPMQNWYAPDLSGGAHGGLAGWSGQDIVDLLKTGQSSKGAAFGPMADVVTGSTQYMTDEDLRAVATYLGGLPSRQPAPDIQHPSKAAAVVTQGEPLYVQHCAACHGKDGAGVADVYPALAGNASTLDPDGVNATRAVLLGGFAPVTAANPRPYSMPPFAQKLSDDEVAALVSYVRRSWGNHASLVRPEDVSRYRHTPTD
jgi:mono/diheme cytochrome c family protein